MKSVEFCYWLQGFFEISHVSPVHGIQLSANQVAIIQKHLNMVFIHEIDASYPKEQQEDLNKAHDPKKNFMGMTEEYEAASRPRC